MCVAKGTGMSIVSHRLSTRVVHVRGHAPVADLAADPAAPPSTLADLPIGGRAVIAGFDQALRADIARRLFDLGFVPGTVVEAARRAPLRDPVIYRVSGVEVALRSSESGAVVLAPAA